jgi:hypothetical protein
MDIPSQMSQFVYIEQQNHFLGKATKPVNGN